MLTLVLFCNSGFSQNLNVIEKELQEVLNQKNDELVSVSIVLKSQVNSAKLRSEAENKSDKSTRREFVIDELKEFSLKTQADVLSYLQAEEKSGKVSGINGLWIVNAISCDASKDVIYKLSSHPDVEIIGYNKEMQLISPEQMKEIKSESNVKAGGPDAHVQAVEAHRVWWEEGYTGKNIVVAVLDSGTNTNHLDLKDHLWKGFIDTDGDEMPDTYVNGWNFVSNNFDITDDYGHGTHCAGIVCGDGTSMVTTGIAPDASLMTVKTINRSGGGSVAQMINGVQFAVENGADIISMSLGFKNNQLTTTQKETIRSTFDNVLEAGVVVCAAAGNDGDTYGAPNNVDYPAACPAPWTNPDQTLEGGNSSVICVGAIKVDTDNDNNPVYNPCDFSSRGPSTWEGTLYNDYPYNGGASMGLIRPDISAPGYFIRSTKYNSNDTYEIKSGTSQATPCVAGVIALMLEKNSTLTPAQISQIIEETATSKPATKNNIVGAGVVNALAAVNRITETEGNPFIKINAFAPKSMATGIQTISFTFKNEGAGASDENTSVTLSLSNDPYVTIINPTQTLGKLGVNNTKTLFFDLDIDSQTPSGHTITFNIATTSGTFNWEETCSVKVSLTPNLAFQSVSPGLVSTNATSDIKVTMVNNGAADFTGPITLKLVTLSNDLKYVTLINDETTIPALGVGETGTGTFTIETKEPTHPYDFFLETYSESTVGRNYVYEFENDLEGWTGIKGSYCYSAPWLHSTEVAAYHIEVGESNSGNGHLKSISYINGTEQQPNSIDNYLVSPVKIKVLEDTKVSFYARANNDYYYKEHFGFAVSTAGNTSVSDFTTIQEWVITDRTTWKKYTVDLSEYYGQEIYVAIRHFFPNDEWENSDNGYYLDALAIDDIIFENVLINTQHSSTFSYDDPYYFNVTASSNPNLPMVGDITATPMSGAMSLEWDAVDGVSKYGIYRDGQRVATVTGTAYVDENLSYNKQYCYAVTTITSYESGLSEEVCATTLEVDKIPAPTNLVATTTSESTIDLMWDIVKEAESYKVYQGTNLIASGITDTKYTVENLDAETNYCFVVTAVNIVGESEYSESACATTLKAKPAPPVVTATADSESAITLTWEAVYGAESYNVYQGTEIIASEITNTTYTITGLEAETNYCFTMTAVNETGESASSESACATTLEAPKAPEAPVVTATADGDNTVILTWNAVENATSYNIYQYQGTSVVLGIAETTYTVENLTPNTTYCFVVTAVNEIGESENSEPACATTDEKLTGIIVKSYDLSNHIGETTLTATLINKCETAIPAGAKVNLSCNDSYVTIVDGTYYLSNVLAVDGTTKATFTIEIAETVPVNYDIDFDISVQYEGYSLITKNLNYTFDDGFEGWTTRDYNNDGETWYHSSDSQNHSPTNPGSYYGSGHLMNATYCKKHKITSASDIIWSPEKIKIGDNTKISFYVRSTASSDSYCKDSYYIVYGTNSGKVDDMFDYHTLTTDEKGKWNFKEKSLSSQSGNEIWIGIWHEADSDVADGLCIDEVTISNILTEGISTITQTSSFTVTVNTSVNIYTGIGSWANIANWSKGVVPISTDDVVINGDVTIENGDITVKSLTINSEKSLTVNEGVKLTVSGKFVSPSVSSLIINDGAQICQTSENVPATFMMKIEKPDAWAEANKTGWQFISSPLKNSEFESFIPETGDYDLYMFDGSKEYEWVNYKSSATSFGTNFEQGRAYMVSYETEEIAVFTGYLNHEKSFTFDIPYQYEGGEFKDFFLLGNPFTFDISWSDIEFSGMIEDYAYVKKDGNYGYATPTSTIKVGDGFFVKALADIGTNTPSVTINLEAKRKKEDVSFINIIAKGKEGTDNVVVNFAGEKEGFPKLENFNDKIANVYVVEDDNRYGIYNYDSNVTEIPVCFEAKQMGTYSISIETEGEFEDIVLVDRFTGEEIRMLFDSEYKFTATNNDNFNRFVIKIVNSIEKSDIFAHQNGEELIIDAEGTIQIIDIMGRMLYNNDVESSNNRIDVSNLKGSTYILRNISDNNGIRIQKIVIL